MSVLPQDRQTNSRQVAINHLFLALESQLLTKSQEAAHESGFKADRISWMSPGN